MRIIGGHDYYDSGLAYGQDEAIVFLRNGDRRLTTREMHEKLGLPYALCGAHLGEQGQEVRGWRRRVDHRLTSIETRREGRTLRHEVSFGHVILCGTLHNGVHIHTTEPYGISREIGKRWIWTADALRAFAAEYDLALDEGRAGVEKGYGVPSSRQAIDIAVQDLDTWFTPREMPRDRLVAERITIAAMNPLQRPMRNQVNEELSWAIDQDGLSDMEFAKAVDPYTAFQEISMWKGGVLPSDAPAMVEITDDKVKIAKAGFHHPTSFRRAKQG